MSRLYKAFRPLLAALPALGVLLWLLAPALSETLGYASEAQASRGSPPAPTPARLLESEAAELCDPSGEDFEDECEADARATAAEISPGRDAVQRFSRPREAWSRHARLRACCIRGPPRTPRS